MNPVDRIFQHLEFLYGERLAPEAWEKLKARMEEFSRRKRPRKERSSTDWELTESDAILITYGDQVREPGHPPLNTLGYFVNKYLRGVVSGVHILPFFPSSSDDGFSVIDYRQVDPQLGSWEDVAFLGRTFRLMFDAVINHISTQSRWFQKFLEDDPAYRDYFIAVEGNPDLSQVVRPRISPLLTEFETAVGVKKVWTTFSADQVDLNFKNPEVLIEVIDSLLFYVLQGAQLIRMDAIAYLWKEAGTPAIHLPQTHQVIRLIRAVLDEVAPDVILITETNVPHADNVSYFGDGSNEAQMVYNFALPPLVLHTIHTGNAEILSRWVSELKTPSRRTTFFNFLASHDGIGLNPVRGILSEQAIDDLVARIEEHGGFVSYKHNPDGSKSPYELNVNYFDALSAPDENEHLTTQVDRFLLAHAIMLALPGVPGVYFHSLFGSRGWPEGVIKSGHHRAINRQKLYRQEVEKELDDPASLRCQVYNQMATLLRLRASHPAFHPHGESRVIEFSGQVFAVQRSATLGEEQALCLHNVSDQTVEIAMQPAVAGKGSLVDMVREVKISPGIDRVRLKPYQFTWLRLQP